MKILHSDVFAVCSVLHIDRKKVHYLRKHQNRKSINVTGHQSVVVQLLIKPFLINLSEVASMCQFQHSRFPHYIFFF